MHKGYFDQRKRRAASFRKSYVSHQLLKARVGTERSNRRVLKAILGLPGVLSKTDFQRETANWEPEIVEDSGRGVQSQNYPKYLSVSSLNTRADHVSCVNTKSFHFANRIFRLDGNETHVLAFHRIASASR